MILGTLRPDLRYSFQHASWKQLSIVKAQGSRLARLHAQATWFGACCGLALLLSDGIALAQAEAQASSPESLETRTVARRMADEAANLYEAGDYGRAQDLFHRANAIYPAPVLELWEARALEKLGRLVEAEEHYASVQRYKVKPEDTDVVRTAVRDAGVEIEQLRKRIPTLTISLVNADPTDPNLEIHLDGKRLNPAMVGFPVPVDVGAKTVTLVSRGKEVARNDVSLGEGDRSSVELDGSRSRELALANATETSRRSPDDLAQERPSPWYLDRTFGWIGVGVGSAGLALGGITGLIAASKHNSLSSKCPNSVCLPAYKNELDSFHTYRTVSTVGYVVGGMALAAGITVLVLAPQRSHRPGAPTLSLHLGPSWVTLRGKF